MRVEFKVEGWESYEHLSYEPGKASEVIVAMETNGTVVMVTMPHSDPRAHPRLTPKGWQQVADYAEKLTWGANEAVYRMGAEYWVPPSIPREMR